MAEKNYKYLDRTGLERVWAKIKDNFSTKTELSSEVAKLQEHHESDVNPIKEQIKSIEEILKNMTSSFADKVTIDYNESGCIETRISLELNRDTQTIDLIAGGSGVTDENKILSSIDYSAFIKDSVLKNVEMVEIGEDDLDLQKTPGTYLKFSFNTDSSNEDIYVNVSDLINIYKGSDFITIDNNIVQLKIEELKTTLKDTFVTADDHANTITNLTSLINEIKNSLNSLSNNVEELENTVEGQQSDITELQNNDVKIENSITDLTSSVDELLEKLGLKADKSDVDNLTEQVEELENIVENNDAYLKQLLKSVQDTLDNLSIKCDTKADKSDVDNLTEQVESQESSITELQNNDVKIENSITNLTSSVDELLEKLGIKADKSELNSLEERIKNLEENPILPEDFMISIDQVTDFTPIQEEEIETICNIK